jgi:dTDP-4-dehydrorhamnose reductase
VHVSTDYVFDGSKREPWLESDQVNPLGAYGRTKLHGEEQVADAHADHAIVRTAWLFGPHGPNFVSTMLRLAEERDEVSVVTDQVGSPTFAGHLAPALVDVAERSDTGLFHGAGAGSCSWYE